MKMDENTYNKIINSNEFIKWFGNWKKPDRNTSKIVDEDGKPLVVYHGSPYKFTEFEYGKNETSGQMGAEYAFWFSDNIKVARDFSLCYPRSYYNEIRKIREKYTKESNKDKEEYLKKLDKGIWEDLLKYFEEELGKSTAYYKISSDINDGDWVEVSKTLESLLLWFGRRNWEFLKTHKDLDNFFDLDKKYEESEKLEIDKIKDYYNNQEGYIYPCFIKASVIEEENGESAGLGLGRLPDGNAHCKIIRNADTGSVFADEYIVTDPKRIKIATGENKTFNGKSKNIYEGMITSFEIFENLLP